ncbi:MAG: ABC transporter permease [Alphaproteobacteria bacterium]|nr:ABC transporter permease [Alphaproteobacteria bacterium]
MSTEIASAAGVPDAPAVRASRPDGKWLIGFALPVFLALAWELAVATQMVGGRLLPTPSKVIMTLVGLAQGGELLDHVLATLRRVALGFVFGVAAGTLVGAVSGYWTIVRRVIDPSLQALRNIPSIAWVPMFILWFGIFETSKVILIAVGVFFPIYLALSGAILGVDRKLVEVGRIFRFSHREMITRILLPATLPSYIIALRSGLGLGWMFVVAAEFMGAEQGLGFLLVDGQQTGRPAVILASITSFAILGKLTDWLLASLSGRFLKWQDGFKPAE